MSREISIAASMGSGAGKDAARFAFAATASTFFCEPLVAPPELDGVVLATGFAKLPGVAVAGVGSSASPEGAIEALEVPSAAAKLPGFPADEFRAAGLDPLK